MHYDSYEKTFNATGTVPFRFHSSREWHDERRIGYSAIVI